MLWGFGSSAQNNAKQCKSVGGGGRVCVYPYTGDKRWQFHHRCNSNGVQSRRPYPLVARLLTTFHVGYFCLFGICRCNEERFGVCWNWSTLVDPRMVCSMANVLYEQKNQWNFPNGFETFVTSCACLVCVLGRSASSTPARCGLTASFRRAIWKTVIW